MWYFRSLNDWQRIGMIMMAIGFILIVPRMMYDDPGITIAHRLIYWPGIVIFWIGIYFNWQNRHNRSKVYEDERPRHM